MGYVHKKIEQGTKDKVEVMGDRVHRLEVGEPNYMGQIISLEGVEVLNEGGLSTLWAVKVPT